MELNISKQAFCANELAFKQTVEQSLDFSVTVPDYLGTVQRILKYTVIPMISSKVLTGQILSVEGTAYFNVIYVDEDNCVAGYEYSVPFSKNIDLGVVFEASKLSIIAKCGYLNVKPITPSRIDVHSVIELQILIYTKKTTEIICDICNDDVYVNKGEANAVIPISSAEKNMIIEEELPLPDDCPPINCIIKHFAKVCVSSAKIVNNKVIVKGDLAVKILYCATDKNKRTTYETRVPFSQIIDVDGAHEECSCNVTSELASFDIKPRASYEGESKSFILNAKLALNVDITCKNNIAVVFDAYSSKHSATAKCEDMTVESLLNGINELFMCQKNLEFSDGDIENIIDLWCNCVLQGYHIESNSIIINGTVNVSVLAENSSADANYFEKPIDFEYKFDGGVLPSDIRIVPTININNVDYNKSGNNCIDVKLEINVSTNIYEISRINLVTDINISDDENAKKCDECSVYVYYADRDEKVWNIAKKYGASPKEIMEINSVGDEISHHTPLIILK